jgi:hypothetical protein
LADLASKINDKTKLVAVGYASNAVGTINPVKEIVRLAHAAGALAYVDAVHYGAARPDRCRRDLDCDFLVCSTYKFFGPHMGVLFGKREHLQRMRPYKVRPQHECDSPIAGSGARSTTSASRDHRLRGISRRPRPRAMWGRPPRPYVERSSPAVQPPRRHRRRFRSIHRYERGLMERN